VDVSEIGLLYSAFWLGVDLCRLSNHTIFTEIVANNPFLFAIFFPLGNDDASCVAVRRQIW